MQLHVQRYKTHTLALVALILAVHTGLFALMYTLLESQSVLVTNLGNIGTHSCFSCWQASALILVILAACRSSGRKSCRYRHVVSACFKMLLQPEWCSLGAMLG